MEGTFDRRLLIGPPVVVTIRVIITHTVNLQLYTIEIINGTESSEERMKMRT